MKQELKKYIPHTELNNNKSTRSDWLTDLSDDEYFAVKDQLTWLEILQSCRISFRTRSTGTLVSLCPLHLERTPSAFYYPKSKRFHCYGCEQDEDIVEFVARVRFNTLIVEKNDFEVFIKSLTAPINNPNQGFLPLIYL